MSLATQRTLVHDPPLDGGSASLSGVEGVMVHDGSTGGGTRPTGYARVRWVGGSARPTNMAIDDVWEHDV